MAGFLWRVLTSSFQTNMKLESCIYGTSSSSLKVIENCQYSGFSQNCMWEVYTWISRSVRSGYLLLKPSWRAHWPSVLPSVDYSNLGREKHPVFFTILCSFFIHRIDYTSPLTADWHITMHAYASSLLPLRLRRKIEKIEEVRKIKKKKKHSRTKVSKWFSFTGRHIMPCWKKTNAPNDFWLHVRRRWEGTSLNNVSGSFSCSLYLFFLCCKIVLSQANSLRLRGRKLKVRLAVAILNKARSAEIDGLCVCLGWGLTTALGQRKHKDSVCPWRPNTTLNQVTNWHYWFYY